MPLLKTIGPYEFRFYSRGEAAEPPHVHVRRGRLDAKFWLGPTVRLARGGRFRSHELTQIVRLVQENQQEYSMSGISTLAELYLGAEPAGVSTDDDRLLIHLSDGRSLALPLEFISQLASLTPHPTDARLLIFSQPPRIENVQVTEDALVVTLHDGRVLSSPLRWFPRLRYATEAQRAEWTILGDDDLLHWPELDEDIELLRLFSGGESLESESSVQAWLAEHRGESLVLNEPKTNYDS